MQIKPELSVVILSYNVNRLLRGCLNSIEGPWRVIVVDNFSTDRSVEMVKKEFPEVEVVKNSSNVGFAAGNNVGIKKVTSDFLLLLNPDTVVYPGTIERVLSYMKANNDVGAATCRVELPDGKLDYSCHRGFPTPWNAFCYFSGLTKIFPKSKIFSGYTASYLPLNSIHEIDALTGAFAMVRKTAGDSVDWLDEDYYWNGEDVDFCYKLREKKWKIVYIPSVKITHFKGSSSGLQKIGEGNVSQEIRMKSALSGTQVMRLFYKKHLVRKYPFFVNYLVNLGISILELFRLAKIRTSSI